MRKVILYSIIIGILWPLIIGFFFGEKALAFDTTDSWSSTADYNTRTQDQEQNGARLVEITTNTASDKIFYGLFNDVSGSWTTNLRIKVYLWDSLDPTDIGTLIATSLTEAVSPPALATWKSNCDPNDMTHISCWTEFEFGSDVSYTAGETYAFVLEEVAGGDTNMGVARMSVGTHGGHAGDRDYGIMHTCTFPTCTTSYPNNNDTLAIKVDNDGTYIPSGENGEAGGLLGTTVINSPIHGTSTASTTFDIIISYDNSAGDYTHLSYEIYSTTIFRNLVEFDTIAVGAVSDVYIASTTHDIGNYTIEAFLYNDTLEEKDLPVASVDFSVIENPLGDIIGIDPDDPDAGLTGLATTTCSLTNLSGCFQNALIVTFYPSDSSLNRFGNLKETIEKKPPFGYFTLLTDTLSGLDASTTPAYALASEANIQTNIFDPLREGVKWIIFFIFGVWLYKRMTHIRV